MIKAIRGFKDILPSETAIWQKVEGVCRKLFHSYGFSEIRLPLLEETALFVRSIGEETDIVSKEMYSFPDRKGLGLTLRPEGTASVVRAFIEHKMYARSQYKKLYYLGPMFRYERPQAGRSRQFHQIGAEVFGLAAPSIDAELLVLLHDLMVELGLSNTTFYLNSVGCQECRPVFKKVLLEYLDKKKGDLCFDCQQRLVKNPLRVLDCKNEACQSILQLSPSIVEYLCSACQKHYAEVKSLLSFYQLPFHQNDRLVRGLDYYTRTAFEIIHEGLGAQNAIVGGGRYDNLVESFGGPATPAVGFAIGMERVVLALQNQNIALDNQQRIFFVVLGDEAKRKVLPLVRHLRKKGFFIEMSYQGRSLKAQLKEANRFEAQYALILGEEELAADKIILKDMNRSIQEYVTMDKVEEILEGKMASFIKNEK